jgi:hypothetical protein
MKVWLVGTNDVEMTYVQHVCLSEKTALKRWEELRQTLIKEYQNQIVYMREKRDEGTELYERMIKNLSVSDPKKLDNYPHDEPFIDEMECEE